MELIDQEIEAYLTHLAVDRQVAASTQNQALSALVFLFNKMLIKRFKVEALRAKNSERLPLVLSKDEVRQVLNHISDPLLKLMSGLVYEAGLRVMEVCRLRVQDIDSRVGCGFLMRWLSNTPRPVVSLVGNIYSRE